MTISLLCCSGSLDGGGSERQLWQLASNISRPEFDPQIYLHYRRGVFLERCAKDLPVHAFWDAYEPAQFRIPGAIHRAQVQHLADLLRRQKIQVAYDRTYHMTLVTAAACALAGVPRVSVIVSPPSQDFGRAGERFGWWKKRKLRAAYSAAAAKTLAVSQSVAVDAAEFYGLDVNAIEIVPSPIDIDSVRQLSLEQTPEQNSLMSQVAGKAASQGALPRHRICVVGRLSDEKGQALAVEAFAPLAARDERWELEIIGDGPDRGALERLAEQLGLAARVHFRGFMDNPYPAIQAADLVLVPSKYEGLPNVALEAMALGTPVIATNCSGSVRELLGDSKMSGRGLRGQVVPAGDVARLSQALLAFEPTSPEWRDRVQMAQAWVASHHGLQQWLERMEALLRDRVSRPAR